MKALLSALLVAALVAAPAPLLAGDRPGDPSFQGRSPAVGLKGMAASAQPLATEAALEMLRAGGSAVDAAIAANAVLGLVEPTGNGIGGDLFALVWDPKLQRVVGLESAGFAPAAVDREALARRARNGGIDPLGLDAVTVPGAVAGWEALHRRYGRLPLARVLAPAVRLGREGFALTPVIARGWAANLRTFEAGRARIPAADLAFALYAPAGEAPIAGQRFTNPDLSATLEAIGKGGAKAFYNGPFAADLEAHFTAHGGTMTRADLAATQARWVDPLSVPYRDVTLWQMPPPTQGLTTLQMAAIVARFPMKGLSESDRLHVLVEAKKLAFADRARFLADPDQAKVPVAGLLAPDYIARRAALIDMARALPDDLSPGQPEEAGDTTYLATADESGLMVSLIQSNYRGMGSGVVVPRRGPVPGGRGTWGFMLQNRGAQFSLDPAAANVIAPRKRPFHTIIPGMATRDGKPWLAFGVMGGTMQPQGQVQVLVNLVDLGLNLQAAGDAPRVRHLGSPDPGDGRETPAGIFLESQIGPEVRAALEAKGHRLIPTHQDVGGYQAVMWDAATRSWWGATEMRKDGVALGY